jgi:diguanylate cyclase (GGDEF)-like protein
VQNVTDARAREDALTAAAHSDALTGLLNRRGWQDRAEAAVRTAQLGRTTAVIAMLDLDHFKTVNDSLGHAGGDALLQACARAWSARLRDGDLLARLGGEEFALLLHCDLPGGVHVLDELRALVPEGQTASGGATVLRELESLDAALQRADAALYQAKREGRNRTVTR